MYHCAVQVTVFFYLLALEPVALACSRAGLEESWLSKKPLATLKELLPVVSI